MAEELGRNYVALCLLIIPLLTILGNLLVVLSIIREKSLRSVTNYFILSLAVADFMVALCVMPFAVYVEVEQLQWNLGQDVCNVYIALDVCASTASILNLMAISIDRYAAIARPIEYSRNRGKNRRRACVTIFLVWFLSGVIALPLVLGVNDPPESASNIAFPNRDSRLNFTNSTLNLHVGGRQYDGPCEFNNAMYIIGSSLGSFYIPCVVMTLLYSFILKRLQERRRTLRKKNSKPTVNYVSKDGHLLPNRPNEPAHKNVKEKTAQTNNKGLHALNLLGAAKLATEIGKRLEASAEETTLNTTTTASSSEEEEDDEPLTNTTVHNTQHHHKKRTRRSASCSHAPLLHYSLHSDPTNAQPPLPSLHIHPPAVSFSFGEELEMIPFIDISRPGSIKCPEGKVCINGSPRSRGRVHSAIALSPRRSESAFVGPSTPRRHIMDSVMEVKDVMEEPFEPHINKDNAKLKDSPAINWAVRLMYDLGIRLICCSTVKSDGLPRRMGQTTRRLIKREQKHLRKETKATQTLAVVLGVFLICWMPFFTVHLWSSLCMVVWKDHHCVDFIYFFLTTWLGYMNSFMNPIIYTIFNPEYRKAFRRILTCQRPRR